VPDAGADDRRGMRVRRRRVELMRLQRDDLRLSELRRVAMRGAVNAMRCTRALLCVLAFVAVACDVRAAAEPSAPSASPGSPAPATAPHPPAPGAGLPPEVAVVSEPSPSGASGESCTKTADCAAGLRCIAQVCVDPARGDEGDSCQGTPDCNGHLRCEQSRCVSRTARPVGGVAAPPPASAPAGVAVPASAPEASGDAPAPAGAALPPPVARSGRRIWFGAGIGLPTGDFGRGDVIKASPLLTLRVGKEYLFDRVGFMPSFRSTVVYWANDLDWALVFLHAGADGRVAVHLGSLVLWSAVGLGADLSVNDAGYDVGIGFGMNIDLGADFLVNPELGLGVGLTWHPGFTPLVGEGGPGIIDVTYLGLVGTIVLGASDKTGRAQPAVPRDEKPEPAEPPRSHEKRPCIGSRFGCTGR